MLVLQPPCRGQINELSFSPDGGALVGNTDAGMWIWRTIADGQEAEWIPDSNYLGHPQFTPNGRWLFAGVTSLKRFDPATGEHTALKLWDADATVYCDVSPTESLMLVTQTGIGAKEVTRVALWRCDDLSRKGKLWQRDFHDKPFWVWPRFLPSGDRFARVKLEFSKGKATFQYHLLIHDTKTGKLLGQPTVVPYDGRFSPDGRWFVKIDGIFIDAYPLDAKVGRAARVRNETRKHFTDLAFHPSGRFLAAPSNDHTVKFFDTSTWTETRAFTWKLGKMRSIAFSADGTLAAAGTDKGQVIVWDVDV